MRYNAEFLYQLYNYIKKLLSAFGCLCTAVMFQWILILFVLRHYGASPIIKVANKLYNYSCYSDGLTNTRMLQLINFAGIGL